MPPQPPASATPPGAGWTAEAVAGLRAQLAAGGADTACPVLDDPAALAAAARDFGGLAEGRCPAVARPASAAAVAAVIGFADRHRLGVTLRGGGLGQGGQSVAAGTLSLALDALADVEVAARAPDGPDGGATVSCGPGASFRRLRDACAPLGLAPAVMPLNLDLTVGGVLAAGGFGSTSHREGLLVSNVRALDVVLGSGAAVRATPDERRDVYDAVLGGLGRFGAVTRVQLALRPLAPKVRTYFLLYDDLDLLLADQLRLAQDGRCQHLEALCAAAFQGLRLDGGQRRPFARWFFSLQLGFAWGDAAPPPDAAAALPSLRHRELVHVEDCDAVEHAARYDVRFAGMRATGAWAQPHPWAEYFLPARLAQQLLPEILDGLPAPLFGDGHRLSVLAARRPSSPALLAGPADKPMFAFAILPAGVPEPLLPRALELLAQADQRLLAAGAKRYLSGWLFQRGQAAWQAHFGDAYPAWVARKQALDPRNVLRSALFPEG
jgi:cytokinin dehydrogenase